MPTFETSDPEQGLFYDAPSVHAPTGFDGVGYHPTSRLCRAPETRFFVTRSRMREHWRTQTIAEGRGIGRQEDAGRGVVPPARRRLFRSSATSGFRATAAATARSMTPNRSFPTSSAAILRRMLSPCSAPSCSCGVRWGGLSLVDRWWITATMTRCSGMLGMSLGRSGVHLRLRRYSCSAPARAPTRDRAATSISL